jgi:predicted metal-dependent hydrolase
MLEIQQKNKRDRMSLKQFLRQKLPDPNQLSLLLDLFTQAEAAPTPQAAPKTPAAPAAPATPVAAGVRRLRLDQHVLDYRLLRSKRRTIGFLIDDEGLRVTAPRWVTVTEIELAIAEKKQWIFNKINEQRERAVRQLKPPMVWRDGSTLPYLGIDITLRMAESGSMGIRFEEASRELHISLPASATEQQLKDRVQGWLQTEAKRVFAERLPLYADKLGVSYKQFALSSATTQWGSCTADGRIRLNWRLIHFAMASIDYVIAHELSHLREMNHSPRFWETLQSVFPEFEAAKKALRDHTPETLPIF